MELDVQSILGDSGRIAQRLERYESRPQQLEMASAVEQAIAEESHLIVEAGTGVGKSFAYLVPAILHATRDQGEKKDDKQPRKRIVISTHTISLQEQLFHRDLPFLNSVLPVEFSSVLVKGRSNYISLRRMFGAIERSDSLYSRPDEVGQLEDIVEWSKSTKDGSRSDLDFRPLPTVWEEVQSEHGKIASVHKHFRIDIQSRGQHHRFHKRQWEDVTVAARRTRTSTSTQPSSAVNAKRTAIANHHVIKIYQQRYNSRRNRTRISRRRWSTE